jgi:hypothetical protein
MLEAKGQAPCFAKGIELLIERNNAYHSVFSWVRSITFVQNRPIQRNGKALNPFKRIINVRSKRA